MIANMKRNLLNRLCKWVAIVMLALAPATAMAQDDEGSDIYDARIEGYAGGTQLPVKSSGLTWIIFIVLMVVAAGGLFKDAKRSHLD